jgi:hypothetical protein
MGDTEMRKAISLIWIAGCIAVAGCGGSKSVPKAAPKPMERPSATGVAKGLAITGNDNRGRPLYEVRTLKSTQSGGDASATLTGTRVTLYHEGVPDLVVEAPNARVDGRTKDLILWGGLTARAVRANAAFSVERMTWNAGTKVFAGAGRVRYTRAPATIECDRLSGRTPVKRVVLDGNVRMEVTQ